MPAATRVQFCVLVEVTWYPTDPPVYPRCPLLVPWSGYMVNVQSEILLTDLSTTGDRLSFDGFFDGNAMEPV